MTDTLKTLMENEKNPDLILTPMMSRWIMKHEDSTPEALARVYEEMTKKPRDRNGSFSASSAGRCLRQQEFAFLGKPSERVVYPHLQDVFDIGTWVGYMYQARLLSAGLIYDIEVGYPWPKMRSMGSVDGVGEVWWETVNPAYRNRPFILELKTVGSHVYSKYVERGEPSTAHLKQISRYSLVSGIDLVVIIAIDKGNSTQDGWHEFVVEVTDEQRAESLVELEELNKAVDSQTLHPLLPGCKIGQGADWKQCDFAGKDGICRRTKKWG